MRNVDKTYFERITADHYIASANGRGGNPDLLTLKLISAARPDHKFTIHLTHRPEEFIDKKIIDKIQAFFADEKAAGHRPHTNASFRLICVVSLPVEKVGTATNALMDFMTAS